MGKRFTALMKTFALQMDSLEARVVKLLERHDKLLDDHEKRVRELESTRHYGRGMTYVITGLGGALIPIIAVLLARAITR